MEIDIAIIGGGAAGIGAARHLAGQGRKVMLIEAAPRLGGRGWTLDLAGLKLDMGCAWLHSASRNVWTRLAEAAGVEIYRRPSAWRRQYRDLGFTPAEQDAASEAFDAWAQRLLDNPPADDVAAGALEAGGEWNDYIRTIVGFISGGRLEEMSAADYAAYEEASTDENWRMPGGYGALISSHFPAGVDLKLSTPVQEISLTAAGVALTTPGGTIRARAAILTCSTAMLADGRIKLPAGAAAWREAAAQLPLGHDEKVIFELLEPAAFEPRSHLLGDPRDVKAMSYGIRPMGLPTIEAYLGNDSAEIITREGPVAAYAAAMDGLAKLLGADVRKQLRPLITTDWIRTTHIGGSYSYARPGQRSARATLARPFENRLFFAGEATHATDFSTAHGAYESGVRAATEVLGVMAQVG